MYSIRDQKAILLIRQHLEGGGCLLYKNDGSGGCIFEGRICGLVPLRAQKSKITTCRVNVDAFLGN